MFDTYWVGVGWLDLPTSIQGLRGSRIWRRVHPGSARYVYVGFLRHYSNSPGVLAVDSWRVRGTGLLGYA